MTIPGRKTAALAERAVIRAERRVYAALTALSSQQPAHLFAMWRARLRRARTEQRRAYRLVYALADKSLALDLARDLRAQGMPLLAAWDRALDLAGLPSRFSRGVGRW